MTKEEIKDLQFRVYKESKFRYEDYLKRGLDDSEEIIDTLINDIEEEYGRSLDNIDKDEVIDYILNYCIDEEDIEMLLSEYYPEIDPIEE